jgi:hypothetical protein
MIILTIVIFFMGLSGFHDHAHPDRLPSSSWLYSGFMTTLIIIIIFF